MNNSALNKEASDLELRIRQLRNDGFCAEVALLSRKLATLLDAEFGPLPDESALAAPCTCWLSCQPQCSCANDAEHAPRCNKLQTVPGSCSDEPSRGPVWNVLQYIDWQIGA